MIRLVWIPLIILATFFQSLMVYKSNNGTGIIYLVFFSGMLLGFIFPFFSRWSSNLTIDLMILNLTIFFSSLISIMILTKSFQSFSIYQLVGIVLISLGFVLLQLK